MINVGTATPNDWDSDIVGTGSVVVDSNLVAKITSPTAGNTARIKKFFSASPGQVFKIQCLARRVSGSDGTSAKISIQYPTEGPQVSFIEITSNSWQKISLNYQVPHINDLNDYITVTIGNGSLDVGEVEVTELEILTEGPRMPVPLVHACGTIQVLAGVATKTTTWSAIGVGDVSYDAGSKKVSIQMTKGEVGKRLFPTMTASVLLESNAELIAKVGQYDPITGIIKIQCIDCTTGLPVDLAPLPITYISLVCLGL